MPPPPPLRGTPLLRYSERDTIPRKNILAMGYYKKWGFYLDGVWLWRISGGYSQEMIGLFFRVLFFVCHSSQMFWCSRSPWSPSGCICWGKDGSRITYCHESTVPVGDSIEVVCRSRSPEFFHSLSLWQIPHSICLIESKVAGSVFLGSKERST